MEGTDAGPLEVPEGEGAGVEEALKAPVDAEESESPEPEPQPVQPGAAPTIRPLPHRSCSRCSRGPEEEGADIGADVGLGVLVGTVVGAGVGDNVGEGVGVAAPARSRQKGLV